MGANAQTSVPVFTAGQVLTAEQVTQINTGIPVFATTVTRDAAFGGAGEKTLAQGQMAFIEATNATQYYNGSAWTNLVAGGSGLTLVTTQVIGTTVASVTVTNAFSSAYDAYLILIASGVGSTTANLSMTLGSTATGYYSGGSVVTYSTGTSTAVTNNNAAAWTRAGITSTSSTQLNVFLQDPFLTKNTKMQSQYAACNTASDAGVISGFLNDTTSYSAFTLTPSTGTLTGGTIRVYGYVNS